MTIGPARRPHAESSTVTAQRSNPAIAAVTSIACTPLPSGRKVAPKAGLFHSFTGVQAASLDEAKPMDAVTTKIQPA